jgi:hypothetical protein
MGSERQNVAMGKNDLIGGQNLFFWQSLIAQAIVIVFATTCMSASALAQDHRAEVHGH